MQEGSLPIAASSKPQPSADPRLTALFEDANLLHLLFKFEKMNVYRIDDLNYLEKQDIYELGVGTVDKRKIDQLMTRLKISAWVTASAPARRTNPASPSAGSPSTTCATLPTTRVSLVDPTNSSCSATMRFRESKLGAKVHTSVYVCESVCPGRRNIQLIYKHLLSYH